jgi:ABC-type antimicrobial peptide transport system permease subunit
MLIRNYFRTAVRHITRSRFFTALNVIGLSIGIAFFLLIAAFAWSEWRVNRDLRHADRQYFLESQWKDPTMGPPFTTLGQLALALKTNYPTLVANYFRWDALGCDISVGDRHFREGVNVVDSSMLDMYGFRMIDGDPHTALKDPFTIVITASKALKYFGRTDVIGRNLTVANFAGGKQDFRITGVMEDPPRNSVNLLANGTENFIFIPDISLSFFNRDMDWQNIYIVSYIELQPGVRPEQLAEPINQLIKVNNLQVATLLQVKPRPLTSYYLNGAQQMITTLFYIAIFILIMAVINFVNLAIGRSASRMKEIGVRKVLGGLRAQLVGQFLTESILLAILATGLSLLFYVFCSGFFSGMLGREMPSLAFMPAVFWIMLPSFALGLGSLAGLYPAFVLSSMPSVESLKSQHGTIRDHTLLRKGLVGFQFGVAIIALVSVLVISAQVRLFFSSQLGYDKDYVVSALVPRDWSLKGVEHMEDVRSTFAAMPEVKAATLSYEIPNGDNGGSRAIYREGSDSTHAVVVEQLVADEHYASAYEIPMAAGAFFNISPVYNNDDSLRMVINESTARALGWKQPAEAVGQRFRFVAFPQFFTIVGVVKDFHFDPMGAPISPEIFTHIALSTNYRYLSFKLRPGNMQTELAALQRQWGKLMPGAPFEYQFMDETLASIYRDELRLQKAANTATVLSLIIVIMGVIGLLSLSVQKRTKEIAIRKVIGASVPAIVRLFLREYLPLLLIAGLAASPLAYWIIHHWLDSYATRITITVFPFAAALGLLVVLMVLLIIGQTTKAALANPVKSLKTE